MRRVRKTFKSFKEYKDFYTNSKGYPLETDAVTEDDKKGIPTLRRWKYGLEWLEKLNCKDILEVGSWTGRFATILKANGYKVDCVEANKAANDYSQVKATNVMFEEFSGRKYDAITAFEVIEHAYDMDWFLDQVKKHLKKNGCFIFSTPMSGGVYDDDNEIHLWIADMDSIQETFEDWEIIDFEIGDLLLIVVRNIKESRLSSKTF